MILGKNEMIFMISQLTDLILSLLGFLSILQGKVWLIDFNPFGEVTDSLLFTWDELLSGTNLKGDFSEGEALEQVRRSERSPGNLLVP